MSLNDLIKERQVPSPLDGIRKKKKTAADFELQKEKIKKLLQKEEYGFIPAPPLHVSAEVVQENKIYLGGKATKTEYVMHAQTERGECTFPFIAYIPNTDNPSPAFVHINFGNTIPSACHLPIEEIVDRGFALITFCYTDVATDNGDFRKLCAKTLGESRRKGTAPGKIAMWAWAAMRVMDFVMTLDAVDRDNVAIVGHSRLGKTALVTGAFDERFSYVISNNSGCSGAALSRGKVGESIAAITKNFPFWFCPNYFKYAHNEDKQPFDQNFLISLSVPRTVIVGSAEEDTWADPHSELLSLYSVNEVYALYGKRGVEASESDLNAPTRCKGDSYYHLRRGHHFLGRDDWNAYMDIILECIAKKA